MQFIIMILALGGMMYFMTRSQKKQQKERQNLLDSVKPGDGVVTIGGLHGVVAEVRKEAGKNTLLLDCEGIFLEFDRTSIKNVVPGVEAEVAETNASESIETVVETPEVDTTSVDTVEEKEDNLTK